MERLGGVRDEEEEDEEGDSSNEAEDVGEHQAEPSTSHEHNDGDADTFTHQHHHRPSRGSHVHMLVDHDDDDEPDDNGDGNDVEVQASLMHEFLFDVPAPSTRALSDLLGQIIVNGCVTQAEKISYEESIPGAASLLELIDEYLDRGSSHHQPKAIQDQDNPTHDEKVVSVDCTLSHTSSEDAKAHKKLQRRRKSSMRKRGTSEWHRLPINVLEQIFALLSMKHRHVASQVCRNWFGCFYSPCVWFTFVLTDTTLTKRKFNYYLGYQRIIDPYKTQLFLRRTDRYLRRLIITPMGNFFNLYEFMNIFSTYNHFYANAFPNLHTLDFTFGCHLALAEQAIEPVADDDRHQAGGGRGGEHNWSRDSIFGTGGKVLEGLKKLMLELPGLRHLALRDLLLDKREAERLLDDVAVNCYDRLQTLTLVNCCKVSYAFLNIGVFVRLHRLVLSAQHINEELLQLLADFRCLHDLYLAQNDVTKNVQTLSFRAWKLFHRTNPDVRVHLILARRNRLLTDSAVCAQLIKPEAGITSIIYDTSYIPMNDDSVGLADVIRLYSHSLECLAFYHLPRYHIARSYSERADASLIQIIENCPRLHTLVIRDMISTSTLLILATFGRNLKRLYVRRNALRKRFDCGRHEEWNDTFVAWLKRTSQSYEDTFDAVSEKLGFSWRPLSDFQFKQLRAEVLI